MVGLGTIINSAAIILGGLIGFLGICLEFPALMTVWSLIRETFDVPMPGE